MDPKCPPAVTCCTLSICVALGQRASRSPHLCLSCFRFENGSEFTSELEDSDDPAAYDTNLSYYHLVPFETDILD